MGGLCPLNSTLEAIEAFDRLVPKAAELHPWTWCVLDQRARLTMGLEGEECLRCSHFVGKGGICDPL